MLPLILLEYYYTKERVTEELGKTEGVKVPYLMQIKAVFSDRYMVFLLVYCLVNTAGATLKNMALVYYCNYVLGTYSDGITQMLINVIGGIPMGIGIFAVWPLAKKFGKKNVTVVGCLLIALGSAVCWMAPTNMVIVLVGQFIKNIGGLAGSYVFMSLFSDSFDHLEWKTGFRSDSLAMSIYSTIGVVLVGVGLSVLNACLNASGYIPPINTGSIEEVQNILAQNGWLSQLDIEKYKEAIDGTFTVGIVQPDSTVNVISFLFVGLEVFTSLISALLLAFVGVEKTLERKQRVIRERQKKACEASGKVWVEPEILMEQDQKRADEEAEAVFRRELAERCQKKGLDYEAELHKHTEALRLRAEKTAAAERKAAEKADQKARRGQEKAAAKLAKLTAEQRAKREACERERKARDEARWAEESQKGEAIYRRMQQTLADCMEKKNAYGECLVSEFFQKRRGGGTETSKESGQGARRFVLRQERTSFAQDVLRRKAKKLQVRVDYR